MSGARPKSAWNVPLKTNKSNNKQPSAPPGLSMPSNNTNKKACSVPSSSTAELSALRDRFVQLNQIFVGQTVTLHLVDGSILEGVFNTSTPFPAAATKGLIQVSDLNMYVIKTCKLVKNGTGESGNDGDMPNFDNFTDGSTAIIPFSKVSQLLIKSCRLQNQPTSNNTNGNSNNKKDHRNGSFQTDTDISNDRAMGKNKADDLVMAGSAWTNSSVDGDLDATGAASSSAFEHHKTRNSNMTSASTTSTTSGVGRSGMFGTAIPKPNNNASSSLEDDGMKGTIGNWDQFTVNEQKFGTKDTWNENLYTTALNRDDVGEDKVREAERIARDIERKETTNIHLAEERGQAVEGDYDEEDRYSGVLANNAKDGAGGRVRAKLALQPRTIGKTTTPATDAKESSNTASTISSATDNAPAISTGPKPTTVPTAQKTVMNYAAAAAAAKGNNNKDATPTPAVPTKTTTTKKVPETSPSSDLVPLGTTDSKNESTKEAAKSTTDTAKETEPEIESTTATTTEKNDEAQDSTTNKDDTTDEKTKDEEKEDKTKEKKTTKLSSKLNANAKEFSFNVSAKEFVPSFGGAAAPVSAPAPVTTDHAAAVGMQPQHQQQPHGGHYVQYPHVQQPGSMPVAAQMMQYPYPPTGAPMRMVQNQYGMMQSAMPMTGVAATAAPGGGMRAGAAHLMYAAPTGETEPNEGTGGDGNNTPPPLESEDGPPPAAADNDPPALESEDGPANETTEETNDAAAVDQQGNATQQPQSNPPVAQAAATGAGGVPMHGGMAQGNAYYPNMQMHGRPQHYAPHMMGSPQQPIPVVNNFMYGVSPQARMQGGGAMHNVPGYGNQMRGAPGGYPAGTPYMGNYGGPNQGYHAGGGGGMEDDMGYRGGNGGRGGRGRGRNNKRGGKGGRGGNGGRGNYNNYNNGSNGAQSDNYDQGQPQQPPPANSSGPDQSKE